MPKKNYKLTLAAEVSLDEIKLFSKQKFGARQAEKYVRKIYDTIAILCDQPLLGTCYFNNDSIDKIYSYPVESHVLFYKVSKETLLIIDILHQSMDPTRNLYDETPH